MLEFDVMFERLIRTRRRYEDARTTQGALAERAALLSELHELRAGLAQARNHRR
jgi:hypothetical protein